MVPLLGALIAAQLFVLALVAWRLPVDYWDGYEYLMNARTLAGHDVGRFAFGYLPHRFPLVPLLVAPLLAWYAPGGAGTSFRGPHLLAFGLSVLSLLALHRLLREAFSSAEALLGCTILALNRLFLHYAPFAMTDIPTMLMVTVAALAYLRARRTGGRLAHVVATGALCAAILGRYTMLLLVGSLAVFEVARALAGRTGEEAPPPFGRRVWRLVTDPRPWLVLGGAVALASLAHAAIYARAHIGLDRLVALFRAQADLPVRSGWELGSELATAFTLPVLGVAVAGMILAACRPTELDLLCLAWFGVVFGSLSLIPFPETRYAFPVVPPLVYFVVRGLRGLRDALRRVIGSAVGRRGVALGVPEALSALALVPLAVTPLTLTARELARFRDPVYARPFLSDVARWVLARSPPGHRILVSNTSGEPGFVYTMYPLNPIFSPHDRYFYFHHVGGPGLLYLLDRPMEQIAPPPPVGDDLSPFVDAFPESEVVLATRVPTRDITLSPASAPEPPDPLTLTAVARRTLRRSDAEGAVYEGAGDPPNRVIFARGSSSWKVLSDGVDAPWQLYARGTDGALMRLDVDAVPELPAALELVKVEQVGMRFR